MPEPEDAKPAGGSIVPPRDALRALANCIFYCISGSIGRRTMSLAEMRYREA